MSRFHGEHAITTIIKDVDDSYSWYTHWNNKQRWEGHGFESARSAYKASPAATGEFLVKTVKQIIESVDQQRVIEIPSVNCDGHKFTAQVFIQIDSGEVLAVRRIDDKHKRFIIPIITHPNKTEEWQSLVNFYNNNPERKSH